MNGSVNISKAEIEALLHRETRGSNPGPPPDTQRDATRPMIIRWI